MKVVMAGASGFLGTQVRSALAGHDVMRLVRHAPSSPTERRWDAQTLDPQVLAGADVVVNLSGAGVGDKRWDAAYRQVLADSRIDPTRAVATAIAALPPGERPRVLVNASAVGFYGDAGDTTLDESSPSGSGFFPDLCRAWEAASSPAAQAKVRVILLRTGLVLGPGGGLLKPLALVTRLFAGGPLAGGRQFMPWISAADWVGAVQFLISREDVSGPVNVVGPDPVRNKDFTRALGRILHRPTPWPVPKFALRIVLGEFANEVVTSVRAVPTVLTRAGYTFQHSTVDVALRAALNQN